MKTFQLKNALFVLAMSVGFIACQKDYIAPAPRIPAVVTPEEKPSLGEPKMQVFTFGTKDLPYTIYTENGATIYVPEKAFTVKGEVVEGEVKVTVQEFLKKGEMIAAGINTMSAENILESYGSLYIDATIDNQPVDNAMFDGNTLVIKKPAPAATTTMVFEGNVISTAESVVPQFNWQPVIDKVEEKDGQFEFKWGTLGWINCDVFHEATGPKTTLFVNLPNNPGQIAGYGDRSNTYVFFVPKGINSAVHIYSHTNSEQVYSYPNSMPEGMHGMLIGYCVKNGRYWYAKEEIVITDKQEIKLELSPSDQATIQKEIAVLNDY